MPAPCPEKPTPCPEKPTPITAMLVGWWTAIRCCGDAAGIWVENEGISEDSRRRGHNGGTFQNRGQFKGLPLKETLQDGVFEGKSRSSFFDFRRNVNLDF
jgi:hypothetical protein